MKALITGVGGFCGPHLIARLRQEQGIEVFGLDRMARPSSLPQLDRYFQCDITQSVDVETALTASKPDCIFHLASLSVRTALPASIYSVNVIGTVNILDVVQRFVPGCRVLLAGSFAEYGGVEESSLPVTEKTACQPVGPYGISKYAATLAGMDYAQRLGLKAIIVRPSNIVGAGIPPSLVVGAMISRAKTALASSEPVMKVGDFDSERDFVAVGDAMDAYVNLLKTDACGEIFNICSGNPLSIRRIAELLVRNSTRAIQLDFDPNLVPPSPVRRIYGSNEKARRAIGFQPVTSMEESLKAAWWAEMRVACESRC